MNREDLYREDSENTHLEGKRTRLMEPTSAKELPPRGELHREKTKKGKWKLNYPIIRLLVLFFILLPITIFSIYSYHDGNKQQDPTDDKGGYERVAVGRMKESTNESENEVDTSDDEVVGENEQEDTSNLQEVNESEETVTNPMVQENTETITNEVEKVEPVVPQSKPESEKTLQHTVTSGDTLYSIAMKYYHSKAGIDSIKQANKLKNNEIQNGQILIIPLD